jgi:hypothetical protein
MQTGDSEGPAWNKFWQSLDNETESMMSGEGGSRLRPHTPDTRSFMSPDPSRPGIDRGDSVMPHESASHHGADSPNHSALGGAQSPALEDQPFPFKFKAPSGRVHRLQVLASAGIEDLMTRVAGKLGSEVESIGGIPVFEEGKLVTSGFALSYLDNEGDTVSITTDNDLIEAIALSRMANREKVDLFVHHPEQPALPPTLDPHPALPKSSVSTTSGLRERRQYSDSDDEDAEDALERHKRKHPSMVKQEEQLIAGVPNDLLLPGAIVTLAIVIVGVFALSRASNR